MNKENIVIFPGSTKHLFEFSGHEFKVKPVSIAMHFSLAVINFMTGKRIVFKTRVWFSKCHRLCFLGNKL